MINDPLWTTNFPNYNHKFLVNQVSGWEMIVEVAVGVVNYLYTQIWWKFVIKWGG